MKILMVHPHDIYHDLEPWTVRITYLAQEIVRIGHKVKLIYHMREPDNTEEKARNRQDFPFETIPFPRYMASLAKRCLTMEKWANWADIVHFQKCHHYTSIPAIYSGLFHRRPIHYDWDDWEQKIYELIPGYSKIGSWIFFKQMERHIVRLVDTISVSSNRLIKLAEQFGVPNNRIFHVPVGADLNSFSPDNNSETIKRAYGLKSPMILYQGQISGANYVHLFLEAASIVLKQKPNVSFVVVGGGDGLDRAKELAEKLEINAHVRFTGAVPHREIPRFIEAADICVACFEDNEQARCKSPLKLAEYLASGSAIVANRMGEVSFMLKDSGLIVEDDQPSSFSKAVCYLLDHPDKRKELGQKARRRAEQVINWSKSAENLMGAYRMAFYVRYGLL